MIRRQRVCLVAALLVATFIIAAGLVGAADGSRPATVTFRNIQLVVDGVVIGSDRQPLVYEGRTYVPIRLVAEALGKHVTWDAANSQVVIQDTRPQVPIAELLMLDVRGSWRLESVTEAGQSERVRTLEDRSTTCNWYKERCYYEFALDGKYETVELSLWYQDIGWEHQLRVLADDREVAHFAIARRDTSPKTVSATIAGAQRLRIETAVDPGGPDYWVSGEYAKLFIRGSVQAPRP